MTNVELDLGAEAPSVEAPAAPPKRPRGRPRKNTAAPAPAKPGRPSTKDRRTERVLSMYGVTALMLAPRLPDTAAAMMAAAPDCAAAWADLAESSPRVAKALDAATSSGSVVGLLLAHFPVIGAARLELAAQRAAALEASGSTEGPAPAGAGALTPNGAHAHDAGGPSY